MNTPNLFSFATSELSQDAFICWLLSWAKSEYSNADKELHDCALNLISAFFKKHDQTIPKEINEINVSKQDKKIDVLCVINNEFAIIIEDKTSTKDHSNQLARYYSEIERRNFSLDKILPIYYKTEDQSNYKQVEENGYKPFLREDILKVLNSYSGKNTILLDYRSHINDISQKVESFKTLPIDSWNWHSWIGFYLELQAEFNTGDWGYVANPTGGFLGFWWHKQGDNESKQYLQLEHKNKKLCFKIRVDEKSLRKHLRNKWNKAILSKSKTQSSLVIEKPNRFGSGNYMTVCVLNQDFRVSNEHNILDIKETIQLLKSAENLLASVQVSA